MHITGGADDMVSYDYTKGKLDELVSIIIDSGAKLFVSAVGTQPTDPCYSVTS